MSQTANSEYAQYDLGTPQPYQQQSYEQQAYPYQPPYQQPYPCQQQSYVQSYGQPYNSNLQNSGYPQSNVSVPQSGLQGNFNSLCSFPYVQIKQKVESMEVLSGFETSNQYAVLDPQGNLLMKCNEKSSMLSKLALGTGRSMDIKITDCSGSPMMNITRPFKLYHKTVTINDASGKLIGSVLKKFAIGKTIFHVMNGQEQQIFTIRGGAFITMGTSRKFSIMNSQGTEVGHIQKEWAGVMKEAFTDADNFSIHFPASCDGETRAILIAATLFIDLSHFEK